MKNIILCLTVVSALSVSAGCATVKETYASDGRKAFTLNCSGTARGWDKCYAAAGEACKAAGYDVLSRIGEDSSFSSVGGNSNGFAGSSVKTQERSMVIACKS